MDPDRFRPRLEEIETRETPSVTPADVFNAVAEIRYDTAVVREFYFNFGLIQNSTTQASAKADLTAAIGQSQAATDVLNQFIVSLEVQAASNPASANAALDLAGRAEQLVHEAQADWVYGTLLSQYIAANPASTTGTSGTTTTGTNGTVNTGSNTPVGTGVPGAGTNGGVNTGTGTGTGGTTSTGGPTGSGTQTGTGTTTGTTTTGTGTGGAGTSGAGTGTSTTGSTSDNGNTTGTAGTTSTTSTP